jgi:Membrane bound beta barrel domain (DUF5777)
MRASFSRCLIMSLAFLIRCLNAAAQVPGEPTPTISSQLSGAAAPQAQLVPVARLEGLEFVNGSGSQIVLERDGKRYLIDTKNQTIREFVPTSMASAQTPAPSGQTTTPPATPATKPEEKKEPDTYYTEDIVLWNLPTAHHLPRKALMIDFTHRFAFNEAFEPGAVSNLFGLDGYSLSAFGFTYGITDRFFAGIYRTPTTIGRIIQLSGGVQLSREGLGHPFSSSFRVGVEGTDHFRSKYITSLELAVARSIKKRAQIYFSPTVSFNNRPLQVVANDVFDPAPYDGDTTVAVGGGLSVDIRPTVAIVGEAIYRVSERLGEHRPSFMLGIQKKIYRHSFTLGLTNSPGTTLSTRSATRGSYGGGTFDDTFGGLTFGFNLSRRLF